MRKRPNLKWSELSAELKRRRVYPVVAAYAVAAWIVLQIAEVTFEPLNLPTWAMPALIVTAILGFPIAVLLAWFFDFSLRGIRVDSGAADSADKRPSIAVLPFTDMSEDQDQRYFCDGVADEIQNALNRLEKLRVAARSSSFRYRNSDKGARQIGRELRVQTLLEGSVKKSQNRLRINVQLVHVKDGYDLWSMSFDTELKGIFAIQDEIASAVAEELLHTIAPAERSALKTTESKDVSAYDYYLRGRHFINRFHRKDIEFARQMFHQAIELDPDFALAWAGCADAYSLLVMYHDPKDRYREQARQASRRAVELDPQLAEAHASRGLALLVSEDFEACQGEFEQAIRLNPGLFQAYYYYARARFHQGDMKEAAALFRKAAEADPEDFQSRCLRVQILRGEGRVDEAVAQAREVEPILKRHIEWNPDDARALHLGAGSLIMLGQTQRANEWLRRALEMNPDDSVLLYNLACNFSTMGDIEAALDYLEKAVAYGMVSAAWMRNDEDLAPLRESQRYRTLLRNLEAVDAAG